MFPLSANFPRERIAIKFSVALDDCPSVAPDKVLIPAPSPGGDRLCDLVCEQANDLIDHQQAGVCPVALCDACRRFASTLAIAGVCGRENDGAVGRRAVCITLAGELNRIIGHVRQAVRDRGLTHCEYDGCGTCDQFRLLRENLFTVFGF